MDDAEEGARPPPTPGPLRVVLPDRLDTARGDDPKGKGSELEGASSPTLFLPPPPLHRRCQEHCLPPIIRRQLTDAARGRGTAAGGGRADTPASDAACAAASEGDLARQVAHLVAQLLQGGGREAQLKGCITISVPIYLAPPSSPPPHTHLDGALERHDDVALCAAARAAAVRVHESRLCRRSSCGLRVLQWEGEGRREGGCLLLPSHPPPSSKACLQLVAQLCDLGAQALHLQQQRKGRRGGEGRVGLGGG